MKLVDRYLIQSFLRPFAACILIFCILVVLGRFFDKMGVFTSYHAKVGHIVQYLFYGLPLWLNMVLPVATLLAVLFSVGQHQQQGEMTALRTAGIALRRLFAPYFTVGLLLTLFSLVGGLTILPTINYKARVVYRVKIKQQEIGRYQQDKVVAAGRQHRRFAIGWLDVEKNEMKDVIMDTFDDNTQLIETISAQKALYRSGRWTFYKGKRIVYDVSKPGEFGQRDFSEMPVVIEESPSDFALQDKNPEDMTALEIVNQIKRLRSLGVPINREQVALHTKIALPFAHIIVIALGIPFALRTSHNKGKVQTFGYALVVAFFYWGTVSVCQSFGEEGHMPAWLAAWMANFIFGTVALYLLRKV